MADVLPVPAIDDSASSLEALFDAHHERLYRLARRLSPSVADAQDLVQETFLRAARAPRSVPAGQAGEAWLVRVLVNLRRDQWRRSAVRARHDPAADPRRPRDPEAPLVAHAAIWRALDSLPPRRRAVVVMHEIEGLDVRRIAMLLGITSITARWHLSKARRELARILEPMGRNAHEVR